jgi:hypothetical protein
VWFPPSPRLRRASSGVTAAAIVIVVGSSSCSTPIPQSDASGPAQISDSKTGAFEAALATRDGGFVAAWYDNRDGNAEIYMRLLDANGAPAGPERRLTYGPEDSYEASIETLGGAVAIAWYDKSGDDLLVPKLGVWELNGSNRWVRPLASAGRNPVISVEGENIFCAWIGKEADGKEWVWAGWWASDGTALAPPQRLAPAGETTWNLNAATLGGGRALIAFDAKAGTRAEELFLIRFHPDSSAVVRLTADDGRPSKYPDVAIGDHLAITWFDERDGNKEVYLLIVSTDSELTGQIDDRARRVTTTAGESIGAYLDWGSDGRLGLAWSDDSEGQHEVYFRPFDGTGQPRGATERITLNPTSSLIPAIRPWRNGFALAWNEFKPGLEAHEGTSEIAFAIVR